MKSCASTVLYTIKDFSVLNVGNRDPSLPLLEDVLIIFYLHVSHSSPLKIEGDGKEGGVKTTIGCPSEKWRSSLQFTCPRTCRSRNTSLVHEVGGRRTLTRVDEVLQKSEGTGPRTLGVL